MKSAFVVQILIVVLLLCSGCKTLGSGGEAVAPTVEGFARIGDLSADGQRIADFAAASREAFSKAEVAAFDYCRERCSSAGLSDPAGELTPLSNSWDGVEYRIVCTVRCNCE